MSRDEQIPARVAPPLQGPLLMSQSWAHVLFVHWALEPAAAAPFLPAGTHPDTLEGRTFVGLVALRVSNSRVAGALPIGGFLQNNVRLYSVDSAGRQGVVFVSLDVSRLDAALAGRAFAAQPFRWSRMRVGRTGSGAISYQCQRRSLFGPSASGTISALPGDVLREPDPLSTFVTARWGLHTDHPLGVAWIPVVHEPWQLHSAELADLDPGLVRATGLRLTQADPVSVLYSPGLVGRIGSPTRVRTVSGARRLSGE